MQFDEPNVNPDTPMLDLDAPPMNGRGAPEAALAAAIKAPVMSGPVMVRVVSEFYDIEPEIYPGFQIKSWVNPPAIIGDLFNAKKIDEQTGREVNDGERVLQACRMLVVGHNGWRVPVLDPDTFEPVLDEQGEPVTEELPAPSKREFWERITNDMALKTVMAAQAKIGQLPNSATPTSDVSKSG